MSPAHVYLLYLIAHGKLAAYSLFPIYTGQNWLDDYKCSGPFPRSTLENSPFSFVLFLKLVHTMSFVWKISFSFNSKKIL